MTLFESTLRRLPTGHLDGWWRQHALSLGLTLGTVLGVVVTLAVTHLVSPDPGLEPGELVILSGRDESAGGQRQVLIDQWNATHPHNMARIIEAAAAHSEMVARAQVQRPDADIYNLDLVWIAEFAAAGYIRPLDESTVDQSGFLASPLRTCVYQDKLWALPFNTDAGLLYYRTDLVQQPPHTWPELARKAKEVLANPDHDQRLRAGYVTQLKNDEGLTVNALEAIQAAAPGRDVVRDNQITVTLEDIRNGIDQLRPGNDHVVLPESRNDDENGSTQAFREGKVLFMRNWPVAYRHLFDKESGAKLVPFDVTPLPGDSVLGGQNLAIAATSTKPKAAQALIEFLTNARSQQILFERGGLAATREVVYHDAEVTKRYPYVPALLRAIQKARPRPVTPCYSTFSETFRNAIDQALNADKPPPDTFSDTVDAALTCRPPPAS